MSRVILALRLIGRTVLSAHALQVGASTVYVRSASLMAGEPPTKKPAAMVKTIGTHNGTFHCDEALACFLLKQLAEYKDATVVRSRDPAVLDTCDVVVDVGGVFDPAKKRYDHHQRGFEETMHSLDSSKKWTTKLSSAGLVYVHHGREVIAETLGWKVTDPNLEKIYDKVYENFMEEIDAIDNGINAYDGEPRYRINTNLSSRVAHLNPPWNEPNPKPDEQFQKAMKLTGEEFLDRVHYYATSWIPARELVLSALQQRQKVGEAGSVVILERGGCPWKDHLLALEEELSMPGEVKFVLYQDQNGSWRVQGVPVTLGSFECRIHLPEKWRGLRDEELSKATGIDGCIFIHSSGFIGGHKTKEGVVEIAMRTIQGTA
uniref:Putative secreted protein n=1 Tax=Amblyomma triste TaxID=251400 RepID=A0A023GN45_AMBTT